MHSRTYGDAPIHKKFYSLLRVYCDNSQTQSFDRLTPKT